MIFTAFLLVTSTHIESYQVTTGPLSRNETYTGISLREESVFKAESSGYVNYYAREAVSYTHLDVYKRQESRRCNNNDEDEPSVIRT